MSSEKKAKFRSKKSFAFFVSMFAWRYFFHFLQVRWRLSESGLRSRRSFFLNFISLFSHEYRNVDLDKKIEKKKLKMQILQKVFKL